MRGDVAVAEQVDELRSRGLQRQAEAAYQLSSELLKSARAAQIEYGRGLVNTLWLMQAGTLVGLPFKAHAGEHPHPTLEHCSGLWLVSFRLSPQHSRLGGISPSLPCYSIAGPTLECFLILSIGRSRQGQSCEVHHVD